MGDRAGRAWVVVLPVKDSATAKSRLTGLTADRRAELALAFAVDCAVAALHAGAVSAVLAVTDDVVATRRLRRCGCSVIGDAPAAGLNAAVQHGTDVARTRWPGRHVAVLPSDLPALRPADLDHALALAQKHPRAFVADSAGIGTNLLTAAPGVDLDPRFEGRSCAAHEASGAVRLDDPARVLAPGVALGLRLDVDDHDALERARGLGVGSATWSALAALGSPNLYADLMQATVASFDDQTRSGTVLADDGVSLPFTAAALEGSRLRMLRPGQRVRIGLDTEGAVEKVQIVTLAG